MERFLLKQFLPILTFLTVAFVGLTMAGFGYVATRESTSIRFQATVDSALNRIESRIDLQYGLMRSTRAFFQAHGNKMSREEFQDYFQALNIGENFSGLRGLGLLGLIRTGNEAAARERIAGEYNLHREIFPATEERIRAPVLLYEPMESIQSGFLGYDMFAEPSRRAAIMAAMAKPGLHATGRLLLGSPVNADQTYPGFLLFARLDQPDSDDRILTEGFLFASFRANELFQVALQRMPLLPVTVEIYDETVSSDSLLFRSAAPPADNFPDLKAIRTLKLGGRELVLQFHPTSGFVASSSQPFLLLLSAFALLLALAMALAIRYRERAFHAAARLHESTEKSLLEKDLMLQEMKHRIKNLIARILAISRQTASGADSIDEFSQSFSNRLQAMSASLDMLTRSRWQKAELGELLRVELAQVFGKELPDGLLTGPSVQLDPTATQALGLTFHELATNALKYGKAGEAVNALHVNWRVLQHGSARFLVLEWLESGLTELQAPAETGFGTRLIDLNITRELNGTIERRFLPTGLEVAIRIPL